MNIQGRDYKVSLPGLNECQRGMRHSKKQTKRNKKEKITQEENEENLKTEEPREE